MAKQKSTTKASQQAEPQRPVEKLFAQYAAYHQNPTNKLLQKIFVPIFWFGLLALVWALPFPHLAFLGKNKDFVNWASFFIAIIIYYYFKLTPVLSYVVLIALFAFSYAIISIEKIKYNGDNILLESGIVIFAIGLTGMWLGYAAEKKNPGIGPRLKHIITAPLYLSHSLFPSLRF